MKTLLPKRTALARAVLSSLTGEVMPVEKNGRAFSRLLIQVLPALAVVGLFSSNAFAADPYIDPDTGRWIGDYYFFGDGTVAGSYAYHHWSDGTWGDGELLDYVNHNNIYGWKDYSTVLTSDFKCTPVTITVSNATVLDLAGIKLDSTKITDLDGNKLDLTANGSTVVLQEGSHASNVYGGYNNSGEANGNTVKITDKSTVDGYVIGGYTGAAGATASGNTVYIENSTVNRAVAGGYSNSSGDAIGNTLIVENSTCASFVYGGYSNSGDASYNKVYYTNASSHVNGGRSESGNANYNEVYYSGGTLIEVFGGAALGDGTAIGNIVSATGSGVDYYNYAGYSSGKGEVADNQFILDGVHAEDGSKLYAGESGGGNVHGNSITVKDSEFKIGYSDIRGGHTTGSGTAYGNTATIDNSYIGGGVYGAAASNGAAYENKVTITNVSTVQGTIYGATGNSSVYSNVVTISDGSTIHRVYGGYSEKDASITGNYVTLSGTIDAGGSIYGGASTSSSATNEVSGNYVNFSGNTTIEFSDKYSIYGGYSEAAAVSGNYVRISGITVTLTNMDSIYGGRTASAAAASNNYVEVSGGSTLTTDAGVYGGSGDSGTVSGNHVGVSGSSSLSTKFNVYGGYSMDGTASQNYVQISDSSKMTAEIGIYGGYSDSGTADGNYVRISSGSTVDSTNGIYGGYSDSGTASKNYISVFGDNTSTVNGDLYGGYSSSGTASNNYVAVFSGSTLDITGDTIYGGYTTIGTASDNYIQITGTVTTADQDLKIYGGYASDSGKVSGNHIDFSGTSTTLASRGGYTENYYYGGYTPGSGDITDNYVSISGSSVSVSARSYIYGGYTTGAGAVSGNNVIISGDSISLSGRTFIYGAYSRGAGTVSDNYVAISGSSLSISLSSDVYGAYSNGGGDVSGNHVEISADSMSITETLTVYGAYSYGVGTVSGNSVTISGNKATITSTDSKIYGGYSNSSGNVSNNTVNISAAIDGTVDIYGGYSGWGAISNNTVNLNSTVSGNVYAGYGASNGRVNNNTINVNGSSLDLAKATLYGRNDSTSGSGNALNLNGYSGTIQNIVNFDAINLDLSGMDLESGQAVVTLTADSTDISNSTITITSTTSSGSENVATTVNALADSYTLIANANGNLTADGATASGTINVVQDSVLYMEYSLYIDEYSGSVLAVSPSYFGGFGDGDGNSGIKVTPAANILPEQHLAVASFLNTATDFALDRKIECTAEENGSVGTCFFGAVSGGQLRQKLHGDGATRTTGTHMFLGVQTKFNNDTSKDIIGAVWAEAGWGTVKANNAYAGSRGHDSYYGLGIRGEHRQKEGALAGAYAQVFAHAGSAGYDVKTTLRSGNSNLSYDKNSMYMGAGIQLGYEIPFNESLSLDTSINYRWLHLEGFKTTSNSIKYKVKDVESHRTRVGTRLSYGKDKTVSNVYAGIAWEQEYSGKAKGSVNGISISDPTSLKGSSAVIEAGVKFKPSKKSRWSFNGSIEGYVGKREGVLGNVVVNYTF